LTLITTTYQIRQGCIFPVERHFLLRGAHKNVEGKPETMSAARNQTRVARDRVEALTNPNFDFKIPGFSAQ
jgi:hypothetical protein